MVAPASGTRIASGPRMRFVPCVVCPWLLAGLFWLSFLACVEAPFPEPPPASRVVTVWDPLACGGSHRVALELEDHDGFLVSGSTPCTVGSLALDVAHYGVYRGRIYAWSLEEPQIRAVTTFQLVVDEPVVRWIVQTPR
jgi:hypothetical protein